MTDRHADGQTDILPQHNPRYAYASRGKKCQMMLISAFLTRDWIYFFMHAWISLAWWLVNIINNFCKQIRLWSHLQEEYLNTHVREINKFMNKSLFFVTHCLCGLHNFRLSLAEPPPPKIYLAKPKLAG